MEQCTYKKKGLRVNRHFRNIFRIKGISMRNKLDHNQILKLKQEPEKKYKRTIDCIYDCFQNTLGQGEYEYRKYANIDPHKILEENLVLSNDHKEVIFKITEEKEQQNYIGYISIDLSKKVIKVWNQYFEEFMCSKDSPYKESPENVNNMKEEIKYQQDFMNKVRSKSYSVETIRRMRRSLIDNRKLHLEIFTVKPNGKRDNQTSLYIQFSSVFKLYQFLELIDKIQNNQIDTLIFQSAL